MARRSWRTPAGPRTDRPGASETDTYPSGERGAEETDVKQDQADRAPARTVDEYLAGVPEPDREALEHLRAVIRATAPEAGETTGYRMPAYTYNGPLVFFAAFPHRLGLYAVSRPLIEASPTRTHPAPPLPASHRTRARAAPLARSTPHRASPRSHATARTPCRRRGTGRSPRSPAGAPPGRSRPVVLDRGLEPPQRGLRPDLEPCAAGEGLTLRHRYSTGAGIAKPGQQRWI